MMPRTTTQSHAVIAALLAFPATGLAADNFAFTVTPAASTVSYDVTASAPFSGTMQGDTTATPATRTKTGSFSIFPPFVNCGTFGPTQNDPLNISGAISGGGSGDNIRPTGSFTLSIDTVAFTATVRDLSLNLLGGATASVDAGLSNFRYPSFCAVNPSCAVPFLVPISLTLGTLDITAITGQQSGGPASGTLTAAVGGGFDFSIPATIAVSTTASFNDAPFPIDPQPLPIVFTGRIVIVGNTATATSNLNLNLAPPDTTTPATFPPTPLTTPSGSAICAGLNLILALTLNSTHFEVATTSSLSAAGTRLRCPCDWNQSGNVSLQDIFDFLAAYFGGNADYNGVSGTTVQDVFDFLGCYFSRPFPC